jgi:hypothetical protein
MWKGQSNFTLERFIAQHRNAFVSMQVAAEHVTYQLPNEHSRVGYLLDAIQCTSESVDPWFENYYLVKLTLILWKPHHSPVCLKSLFFQHNILVSGHK